MSTPVPPLILSLPVPPSKVSLPSLPFSVSLPARPTIRSLPRPPEMVLTALVPVRVSLLLLGWVESVWFSSAAPMSGELVEGCGRAWPSWSVPRLSKESAPLRAGLAGAVAQRDHAVGVDVAGAEQACWRLMPSRSPAMLPMTSLPKTLWPLLMSTVPEMSALSAGHVAGDDAIGDVDHGRRW